MLPGLRFLWNSTRGHRLAPWRSPYLLWRVETYCGVKMQNIGFLEFWGFLWRERANLKRFLAWTAEMQHYTREERPGPLRTSLIGSECKSLSTTQPQQRYPF